MFIPFYSREKGALENNMPLLLNVFIAIFMPLKLPRNTENKKQKLPK
jgi:hypothetical protein